METNTNTDDSLARRLVAQVAAVTSDRPNRPWALLAEIVNRVDVSWHEAELGATLAVAEGWNEYHAHSLLLREPGPADAGRRSAAEASQAWLVF